LHHCRANGQRSLGTTVSIGAHASGRQTYGHNKLVDQWGEVVLVLPHGEVVVMGEMDPERLKSVRHNLQALKPRRLNTTVTEIPVKQATKTCAD